MKALVLGGCGFIGSHVVDALIAGGHEVVVFDRTPMRNDVHWPGVRHFLGALDQFEVLSAAIAGVDVIFHLVSTTVPSTSNLDPVADVEGNLIGTLRLLDLMRETGCKRIVYFSSGGTVYGEPTVEQVDESQPLDPISSYGVVKVAVEKYLGMYQRLHGIDATILRASNPYGPRQGKAGVQGLIGTSFQRILTGQPIDIWGDGSSIRDYIYVEDLAKLAVLAATNGSSGVFNAGSGQGHSVNDIVGLVARTTGTTPEIRLHPGRGFDVRRIVLSIEKAKSRYGWFPEVPIDNGLVRTWISLRL